VGAIIGKSVIKAICCAGRGQARRSGRASVNEARNVFDIAAGHFSCLGETFFFRIIFQLTFV
jgi:hypothetical protein